MRLYNRESDTEAGSTVVPVSGLDKVYGAGMGDGEVAEKGVDGGGRRQEGETVTEGAR